MFALMFSDYQSRYFCENATAERQKIPRHNRGILILRETQANDFVAPAVRRLADRRRPVDRLVRRPGVRAADFVGRVSAGRHAGRHVVRLGAARSA